MINKLFKIKYLSEKFYKDFPNDKYSEIEHKEERPYIVFIINIENHRFGIPFRTNIKHDFCYKFTNTDRTTQSSTGIDFSKTVIIDNPEYIGDNANIDQKEFNELNIRIEYIIRRFKTYVKNYIKYTKTNNIKILSIRYKYCTLKYFHKELGLV